VIARVEFDYPARDHFVKLAEDPASLHILQGVFGDQVPEENNRNSSWAWPSETLIDVDTDGPALTSLGVRFHIKSFKGTMTLKEILPAGAHANGRDVQIQIQVPNIGLLAIDEVEVLEDVCTYELQGRLDQGWRILAVCPPNAQRRPDYIIGRTKGDHDRRR
jgi:hypothetical protein